MYTFIVRFLDGSKSFLSCGVPQLSFDVNFSNFISFDIEVHTDSATVLLCKVLLCLPSQQGGFSYS